MVLPGSFLLILITIFTITCSINCQPTYNSHACLGPVNDTASADYISSLNSLFDSFSSKASSESFYNDSSNEVFSLYLCRGDVSATTCQICVSNATQQLRQRCPSDKRAIIWYDECMLRYSNINFFGRTQTIPWLLMWNVQNNTSLNQQNYGALGLIFSLVDSVPFTDLMFETKDSIVANGVQRGYALLQCTRDINSSLCRSCLATLADEIQTCCQDRRGWRILCPSCNLRYEEYAFYEQPSVPGSQPTPNDGGGNNTAKIAIITVSSVVAVAATLLGLWYYKSCCRRKSRKGERTSEEILLRNFKGSNRQELMDGGIIMTEGEDSGEMHYISLTTLLAATNNFSDENKLGEGGFGPVYKGKLPDGKEVAVKRLSLRSSQGLEEFRNEVILIIKLQHKNLVRLLGYCLEGGENLLVYEYMANTSLDAFLFDPVKSKELDWEKRANIIKGTARGLLYLHEDSRLKIIHRDMKASNVLLDDEMNPKISDFGTARIFGGNQLEANTERVVGTYGYMAPEYALEGLFSIKSDVYSFGILLLEIISGKKNRGIYLAEYGQSLLTYAWRLWNEGKGIELIDPNLVETCPVSEALRWIHIALLCVQDDPAQRPTMSVVVLMLGSKAVDLPQPSIAPYSAGRFMALSDQTTTSTSGVGTGSLADQSTASTSGVGTSSLASDQTSRSILR